MTENEFSDLIRHLTALPVETEWVEFKVNNFDPAEIGRNISAVSNGAALQGKPTAYLVWGVEDGSHRVVGTEFRPDRSKKGNFWRMR